MLERADRIHHLTQVVASTVGPLRGYGEDGLSVFKGVRYGAPPTGARRFLPPQSPRAWSEPFVAIDYGAPAIQSGMAAGERGSSAADPPAPEEPVSNEDCLFLNIWSPGLDAQRRPVMVWLHGGGFANGSGGAAMYDGGALARKGDVVVVTVNHRLNVFGYLHLAEAFGADYAQSGAAGMLDIVQALQWVRANIAAFGGNPDDVTIFGESGGGWKVSLLMAMPAAAGLFHKAIIQSGPGLRAASASSSASTARALLEALGVRTPDELAAVPTDVLSRASVKVPGDRMRLYTPVVDGVAIPRDPFEPDAPAISSQVPLLIGTNKDEATLFLLGDPKFGDYDEASALAKIRTAAGARAEPLIAALRQSFPDYSPSHLFAAAQTALGMWGGSITLAERKAAAGGAAVFMYLLTWETPVARGRLRCPHAIEIPLVFDNVEKARNFVGRGEAPQQVADQMSAAWLRFVKTGDPGWAAYDGARRATMRFDIDSAVVDDPYRAVRLALG